VVCGLRLHSGRGGPLEPKAQLLHLLHSTESSDSILYIQPPSTFVAHLRTTCECLVRRSGDASFVKVKQSRHARTAYS